MEARKGSAMPTEYQRGTVPGTAGDRCLVFSGWASTDAGSRRGSEERNCETMERAEVATGQALCFVLG